MFHRTGLFGSPGSGKTTCGLSYPKVQQHVFGSSEEDTAIGFKDRSHILPPVKFDWFDCLTAKEKEEFTREPEIGKEVEQERKVTLLQKTARARNISKYRRYLYGIKNQLLANDPEAPKTLFLDNGTPFAQEFGDYVEMIYADQLETRTGSFDIMNYYKKFQEEVTDFFRFFCSMPCHTVVSFHIAMAVDEELASKVNFLEDAKRGVKHPKEWQPMIVGKAKYALAGIFTWAFYLWTEESAGRRNEYYAKLEADSSNVGIAKGRVIPFDKPNRIPIIKGGFFQMLEDALNKQGEGK